MMRKGAMSERDFSAAARRAAAERMFSKQNERKAQATEREREEAARIAALDEKTARLRAARLAREAEDAAAKKAK